MTTKLQKTKLSSLRQRIFLTLSLLSIVRIGSFIPLPYIDQEIFNTIRETKNSTTSTDLISVLNTFSTGGREEYSLFSLGILPYINASIIIQLVTTIVPSFSRMQKEEGEYGRRKLTDYTRYLTFILAIVESINVTINLKKFIFNWNFSTASEITLILLAGSMIVLWFSELITRKGLGNGSSLIICFNIIASLPESLKTFLIALQSNNNYILNATFLGISFILTTMGCIFINEAMIYIPLISARQLLRKPNLTSSAIGKTILPLRINQAGVMPLVFTSYVMLILSSVFNLVKEKFLVSSFITQIFSLSTDISFWIGKLLFWIFYSALIFFFTDFYSTILLDPNDVSERFRKNSVIIKDIPPGILTKVFLIKTLGRISRINAIFLITLIIGSQLISTLLHLNVLSVKGLGFTSQIILVNVLIDTLKRIKGFLNEEREDLEKEKINKL